MAIIGTRGYPSYYGGFETAVRRLAPYLADSDWDVTVYGRDAGLGTHGEAADPRIKSVITIGLESKSLSTLSYGLTACLHAMIHKPDVALVMNVANGFWLPLLRLRGIPTLVNVDGIEWDRAKWGRIAKAVFRRGAVATARWGNRMVYDSTVIAARWRREFKVDGDFIPYGGDVPPPLPVLAGLERRAYVLVVARFVPENSISEFFAAASKLAETTDVVIVGSSGYQGELDEQAQQLADSHERVRWLGHVSDDEKLQSLWQHAGAYFHGHSVGGTNPALVSAMAAGSPTVARDTPYNREVLGEAGVFVQPDADEIVVAVRALLADRAKQDDLSARAVERATSVYSWEGVCASYEAALEDLVRGRRLSR
ncbi:glycosyltransferase [Rathayibacter sp. VKM Ac-2803]|uniref:glycosyltransferase n=1 Tax=Rathayibacter sp. VKM Ac-2803 TaxID=2609256 RepID=UPI001F3FFBC6|nr:glycosyltransferase [Rathayibacter sp. VKM Ac-2803]